MGLDIDYYVAKQAIGRLERVLSEQPHGERGEIADEIIELVDVFVKKWEEKQNK